MNRRTMLKTVPVGAATMLMSQSSAAEPQSAASEGMITRMANPENLETPNSELTSHLTRTESFYVRSHFPVPKIDPKTWRLRVEGHVDTPLTLSLADLQALPSVAKDITLECAGNGRVFLDKAVAGLQWGNGGVSTATWHGVTLNSLLKKAGVKEGAVEVAFVATDRGTVGASPADIAYDRSIPLAKASQDEVLLAYGMNDDKTILPPAHGFPLRLVVGGWYGMASVKWLSRIVVLNKRYDSFWQTFDYSYYTRRDGDLANLEPVTAMQPKAIITSQANHSTVDGSKPVTITGAAWAGEAKVGMVEVSVDGGQTWAKAELTSKPGEFVWCHWSYTWTTPAKGPTQFLAKCTDANGKTQPLERDGDRRSYMINHLIPVNVVVQ